MNNSAMPTNPQTDEIERDDLQKWRSVFIERRADFITLDGWTGRRAWEQVWRAVDKGWLTEDVKTSESNSYDQYTAACFRPTDALRAALANTPREGADHGDRKV